MARKKKKKHVGQEQKLAIAQRELDKGNARQALKHARMCHRQDPSESTRSILQRALLSRGRELHARSMHEPARAVVVELDELGEVATEYRADANRLRALLGLDARLNGEPCDDPHLKAELADQAVLGWSLATRQNELQATAADVRAALSAVESGRHQQAVELVAAIGRESPFGDWKLFVRGLCAYYDRDDERAEANFSRLTPGRPAHRIAESLRLLSDSRRYLRATGNARLRADRLIRSLETPLLVGLRSLRRKCQDANSEAQERAELGRFMKAHAASEPEIAQRVANIFISRAVSNEDAAELEALKRVLPPLPLDPRLNRARAALASIDGDLETHERYWNAYVKDLRHCTIFTEAQKSLATGLIYCQVALRHLEVSTKERNSFGFMDDDDCDSLEMDAEVYLRKSLAAYPDYPLVHLALGRLLAKQGRNREAAATFREIARRFPEDAESLAAVAQHFILENEPGVAKEYARQLRSLKPRDNEALTLVWAACLGTARQAAKQSQFRLAETELDEAESLLGLGAFQSYVLLSLRAAIAMKEGNEEAAERYLDQTIQQFKRPTAALLLVDSQARRCGVPAKRIKALGERLTKACKGAKNSEAGGVMAKYMYSLATTETEYQGIVTHTKQVEDYLSRCGRVKWQAEHLVEACRFAALQPDRRELLHKLAKRGASLFPHHPTFPFYLGEAEMMKGPLHCDRVVGREAFERAIQLDRAGSASLEESQRQAASRWVALLEQMPRRPLSIDLPDLDDSILDALVEELPDEAREKIEASGEDPREVLQRILGITGS